MPLDGHAECPSMKKRPRPRAGSSRTPTRDACAPTDRGKDSFMDRDDIHSRLEKLIETCKDGEYGFRTSAEHVKSQDLKTVFLQRAEDCRRGASELQELLAQLGGKPDTGSSVMGTLHRGWVSVRSVLSGRSDAAILDECERGEDAALERYREAIKSSLPPEAMAVVQRQYEGVKRNHDQIRTLRNQVHAVS